MSRKPTITPDQWREAEALAVGGVKFEEISRRVGISAVTLRKRARDHDWPTPGRIKWKKDKAEQGGQPTRQSAPETLTKPSCGDRLPAALVPLQQALKAAAGVDPERFQSILASYFEILLAEGMKNIHPPRNVGELSRMSEMHRKAAGLDRVPAGGRRLLFRPMVSVRRAPEVEAEVVEADPLEGFEI